MKCPTCEIGNLVEGVRDVPYSYKGKKTMLKAVRGRFCDNRKCREVVMDKDESARTSREMLAFNKKVNAELTPIDLLTQVREQLKLTQQEAAKIFGGGPNAFSRYESGKTKPPVALVKLFKVLNKHPDLLEEITEGGDDAAVKKASRIAASKRKRRAPARSAHA
ncbi:MAG: type II toxin-antitoxin system MqsA family antitoxin [Betaproteobacteria bacterium]|nr:type II toxin-antitoxin system MqsA family antitoxin [Betaproteobacteria bacterium]